MYEEAYEEIIEKKQKSQFENRILSIVTNTRNEISVLYYNQGKKNAYKEIQKHLVEKKYQLVTTSKYLDTIVQRTLLHEAGLGMYYFFFFLIKILTLF